MIHQKTLFNSLTLLSSSKRVTISLCKTIKWQTKVMLDNSNTKSIKSWEILLLHLKCRRKKRNSSIVKSLRVQWKGLKRLCLVLVIISLSLKTNKIQYSMNKPYSQTLVKLKLIQINSVKIWVLSRNYSLLLKAKYFTKSSQTAKVYQQKHLTRCTQSWALLRCVGMEYVFSNCSQIYKTFLWNKT